MTSYRFSSAPKERKVGRFLGRVRRELQAAFAEEKTSHNLTQAQIARELGVDRSVINRQLMGTENLTLRRIGELAWAMGRDIHFSLVKPTVPIGLNSHPQTDPAQPNTPSSKIDTKGKVVEFPETKKNDFANAASPSPPGVISVGAI
jgi:transcriptional regulator with XRE-family HTH domain